MLPIEIVFFKEGDETTPVLDWLRAMRQRDARVMAKCLERIERLAELGHELRRPDADLLRDGIRELRIGFGGVNYRILYFLYKSTAAVLAQGLTKEDKVPNRDIDLAIDRRRLFENDPDKHTYRNPERQPTDE